ncbi:hypothetical protein E2C01_010890 [Portunus trituberculatus]|uniref:Uncharacterized protein n=1 Tax=Portunus trituberculatus TaxID=210409 RepID=A0A5B7D9Y7_PORTR|nr:hypothetical protein [Portunus trituberculatus]
MRPLPWLDLVVHHPRVCAPRLPAANMGLCWAAAVVMVVVVVVREWGGWVRLLLVVYGGDAACMMRSSGQAWWCGMLSCVTGGVRTQSVSWCVIQVVPRGHTYRCEAEVMSSAHD